MSSAMEESRKMKKRKKVEEDEAVEKLSSSDEAVSEKKSKKSKKVKKAKEEEGKKSKKDKKDKKEKKSKKEKKEKESKKDKKKDKKDKKDKKKKKTKKREPSSDEGDSNDAEEKEAKRAQKRRKREANVAQLESEAAATMAEAVAEAAKPDPSATTAAAAAGDSAQQPAVKTYPPPPPGNVTLLLFYQYVRPSWTPSAARNAENYARDSLTHHGCTGRLRCAREGFNGTLTGSAEGIRGFCQDLRDYDYEKFGATDFKIVDGLRDNQRLKGLKVWHVEELVTYGFGAATATRGVAPLEAGGTHLPPEEWHAKAAEPDTVLIDVRNANENAIGRFQPLGDASRVLDPNMRTSTEFPAWVDEAFPKLQAAKQVLMYCTGGIRCERASALLVQKGLDASKVFQLEGGIHRYLEAFPTGGHWIGKNYTFDRRFAHGPVDAPPEAQVPVGRCCLCKAPWERYQAHKKCAVCRMEVLLCRECERSGKYKGQTLKCHLCGGPKPSYLPDDDDASTTFKPTNKKSHRSFEAEGDY